MPALPGLTHSRWITSTFGGPLMSCAAIAPAPPSKTHNPAQNPDSFLMVNKPPLAPEALVESNVRETSLRLRRHICDIGPEDSAAHLLLEGLSPKV
jgi:hypothetical protein